MVDDRVANLQQSENSFPISVIWSNCMLMFNLMHSARAHILSWLQFRAHTSILQSKTVNDVLLRECTGVVLMQGPASCPRTPTSSTGPGLLTAMTILTTALPSGEPSGACILHACICTFLSTPSLLRCPRQLAVHIQSAVLGWLPCTSTNPSTPGDPSCSSSDHLHQARSVGVLSKSVQSCPSAPISCFDLDWFVCMTESG